MEIKAHTFADYVKRTRKAKRLSLVDVERQSGGQITNGYISRIENGYILNVTPKKLSALARGLQVSEDDLFALARGKSLAEPSAVENQLLNAFRATDETHRQDLLTIALLFQREYPATDKPNDKPATVVAHRGRGRSAA